MLINDAPRRCFRIAAANSVENFLVLLIRGRHMLGADQLAIAETEKIEIGFFLVADNEFPNDSFAAAVPTQ